MTESFPSNGTLIRGLRTGLRLTQADLAVKLPDKKLPLSKKTLEKCEKDKGAERFTPETLTTVLKRLQYFARERQAQLAQLETQLGREDDGLWQHREGITRAIADVLALKNWEDLRGGEDRFQVGGQTPPEDWPCGVWTGTETWIQKRNWQVQFKLTMRIRKVRDERLPYQGHYYFTEVRTIRSRAKVRDFAGRLEEAKEEVFEVAGKIQGRFLRLEYQGRERAQRFGNILLERMPGGVVLRGSIIGYSSLMDELRIRPAIGMGRIKLRWAGQKDAEKVSASVASGGPT